MRNACQLPSGGSAPATPGFNAVAPEWFVSYGAAEAAPVIPAAESTLGSHPCVALSSAQVLPEWINRSLAVDAFASNGDYPLNFVSHSMGSLQPLELPPLWASNALASAIPALTTFGGGGGPPGVNPKIETRS
jgi:hypothetical protein